MDDHKSKNSQSNARDIQQQSSQPHSPDHTNDNQDLLASDHKDENNIRNSQQLESFQVQNKSAKRRSEGYQNSFDGFNKPVRMFTNKSKGEAQQSQVGIRQGMDTTLVESLMTVGEMGIQGTKMQFIEIEKLAQKKMHDEISNKNAKMRTGLKCDMQTFQPHEPSDSMSQKKEKFDMKYQRKQEAIGKTSRQCRNNRKVITSNAGSAIKPLHQPTAQLKELNSPENTMLASQHDSHRSQSLSPVETTNIDRSPFDTKTSCTPVVFSPSKKIIDIVKRDYQKNEYDQNLDIISPTQEYLILTHQQDIETMKTTTIQNTLEQPRMKPQEQKPIKQTLKKHKRQNTEDFKKLQEDCLLQQEKIIKALARKQCKQRESTYIKRQKILSANPARNRSKLSVISQNLNSSQINQKQFRIRSPIVNKMHPLHQNNLKKKQKLEHKEGIRKKDLNKVKSDETNLEKQNSPHHIPYGVLIPSELDQRDEISQEAIVVSPKKPWQSATNKQRSLNKTDRARTGEFESNQPLKSINQDIMMELQIRSNTPQRGSDQQKNYSKMQNRNSKAPASQIKRKKSFIIYHQAIENQCADFLIVEETSNQKEQQQDGTNASKTRSERSQSPFGGTFQSNQSRRPKTSNRYMLPFNKNMDKKQTKIQQVSADKENSTFAIEHDMLPSNPATSTTFKPNQLNLPAGILRQTTSKLREDLEDRIFRIPTPLEQNHEQNSPTELVTPTNFSLRTAPYSTTGGALQPQAPSQFPQPGVLPTETVEITEVIKIKQPIPNKQRSSQNLEEQLRAKKMTQGSRKIANEDVSGNYRRAVIRDDNQNYDRDDQSDGSRKDRSRSDNQESAEPNFGDVTAIEEETGKEGTRYHINREESRDQDMHVIKKTRERYLNETRKNAFMQSQKHLKSIYKKNNLGHGSKSTSQNIMSTNTTNAFERDPEIQLVLQNQFGLLSDTKTVNGNSINQHGIMIPLSPSDLEMILMNDSNLRVTQMKPEKFSLNSHQKSSNKVLSEGISFSVLTPTDDKLVQIATRPKTSHNIHSQKQRQEFHRDNNLGKFIALSRATESNTAISKISKDNVKLTDFQSQQIENNNVHFQQLADAYEKQLSNDPSSSAAVTYSQTAQPIFTSFGTHGFFPTRKQSVLLQSTSLRTMQQLHEMRRKQQRKYQFNNTLIGYAGQKLSPKNLPNFQKSNTQIQQNELNYAPRDIISSELFPNQESGPGTDNGQQTKLQQQMNKKTCDAQTGVYMVSQGFGVDGVILSSQHHDTVNQSSIRAWQQKQSLSPSRSIAIDNEPQTAKSIKSIIQRCPSPHSRILSSTLDDRKDLASLFKDKDSFNVTRSKEGIKLDRNKVDKAQESDQSDHIDINSASQKQKKPSRMVKVCNRQRQSGKILQRTSVTDLSRNQSGADVYVPSNKSNKRHKSQLADHVNIMKSQKNIAYGEANPNKDLAHVVSQTPEDTSPLDVKARADSELITENERDVTPISQDALDERKKIMKLANEEIDVENEVHRPQNIEYSHGQASQQVLEGKFNVDMIISSSIHQYQRSSQQQNKNIHGSYDDFDNFKVQTAYKVNPENVDDENENSSQISDLLRSKDKVLKKNTNVQNSPKKQLHNKETIIIHNQSQNRRNSQISLTIKTKRSSKGKPVGLTDIYFDQSTNQVRLSELNVVLPTENNNNNLVNGSENQMKTALLKQNQLHQEKILEETLSDGQQKQDQLNAGSSINKTVQDKTLSPNNQNAKIQVPFATQQLSNLSDVEKEIYQRIQPNQSKYGSQLSIFSPKYGKQGGLERQMNKNSSKTTFNSTWIQNQGRAVSAYIRVQKNFPSRLNSSNQILPKVQGGIKGTRQIECKSPQSIFSESREVSDHSKFKPNNFNQPVKSPPDASIYSIQQPNSPVQTSPIRTPSNQSPFCSTQILAQIKPYPIEGYVKLTPHERETRYIKHQQQVQVRITKRQARHSFNSSANLAITSQKGSKSHKKKSLASVHDRNASGDAAQTASLPISPNRKNTKQNQRQWKKYLTGIKASGSILSSKVPVMVDTKNKGSKPVKIIRGPSKQTQGRNVSVVEDQEGQDDGEEPEQIIVQLNDPNGKFMKYRRSIRVGHIMSTEDGATSVVTGAAEPDTQNNQQISAINVQTLLGRQGRISQAAFKSISHDGKDASSQALKTFGEERRLSNLKQNGAGLHNIHQLQNRDHGSITSYQSQDQSQSFYRQMIHNKQSALRLENNSSGHRNQSIDLQNQVRQSSVTYDSKAQIPMIAQYNACTLTSAQQIQTNSIQSSQNQQIQKQPLINDPTKNRQKQLSPIQSSEQMQPLFPSTNPISPKSSSLLHQPPSSSHRRDRLVVKMTTGGDQDALMNNSSEIADSAITTEINLPQLILDQKYKIHSIIEKGTFGDLYSITERQSGHQFWLKSIQKDAIGDEHQIKQFEDQLKRIKQLKNTCLQQIREKFQDENRYYIILDGICGSPLLESINFQKEGLSELDVQIIIKQLLQGISDCHQNNLVLGYLQPKNIYMQQGKGQKSIKLASFSSSIIFSENEHLRSKWTPKYWVAPEQQAQSYQNDQLSKEVDMWRLGILANILLSGTAPFSGCNSQDIFEKSRSEKFSFQANSWRSVSYDAKDFISKLLSADPKKRMDAIQASKHAWIRKACDIPIARKVPTLDPESHWQLRLFAVEDIMRETLLETILNQVIANIDFQNLQELFESVDKDQERELSVSQLTDCLVSYYGQTFTASNLAQILPDQTILQTSEKVQYDTTLSNLRNSMDKRTNKLLKSALKKVAFFKKKVDKYDENEDSKIDNQFANKMQDAITQSKQFISRVFNSTDDNDDEDGSNDFGEEQKLFSEWRQFTQSLFVK